MMETRTKQKDLERGNGHHQYHLMSKVILLIGNDAGVLHSLAVEFAAEGGDIALVASRLPAKIADEIRKSVQLLGGRFLHLESDGFNAAGVIQKVREEMGGMDILVDMSAKKSEKSETNNERSVPQPQWWLSKNTLQELMS
jgi:NAD(P)-dependent dehydrogenase (short-subunit alcohol dehydrogenase family)